LTGSSLQLQSPYILEAMSKTQMRKFVGVVREGRGSTSVQVEARNEAAATKLLEVRYGTENIIEMRAAGESENAGRMSRAESEMGKAVTLSVAKIWVSVAKWVLRGAFKR
jgi:hypothetical protein